MSHEWVKLNVGGIVYQTTRTTLMKDENSMIYKMFSQDDDFMTPCQMDDNGCYLIDRYIKYRNSSWIFFTNRYFQKRKIFWADIELFANWSDSLRAESQRQRNSWRGQVFRHSGNDWKTSANRWLLELCVWWQCSIDSPGCYQSFDSNVLQKWT